MRAPMSVSSARAAAPLVRRVATTRSLARPLSLLRIQAYPLCCCGGNWSGLGLVEREYELEAIDAALARVDEGSVPAIRRRTGNRQDHPHRAATKRKGLTVSETETTGTFSSPADLKHNRALIADPAAFAKEAGAASWLYMCGEEFASMEGGMSYADVQAAVPQSVNLVADPPREFDMDVARRGVAALDELPRPTLVTCRTGPRSSALVYLYSGLRSGASADEVLARAEADDAPFTQAEPLKAWVARGLTELS